MGNTDLEALLEMGFEKARAEMAVKKTGGLQGALEWLETNQDKSLEDITAEAKEDQEEQAGPSIAAVEGGDTAHSLVCNDCGKMFRTHDQASFHAAKTDHTDFSESTEEIAPLTEEQKKAKLEELREKVKAKKAMLSDVDKEDSKKNEKIRQKATRETQDMKEELARKEQIKEAAKKKQEKQEELEAKRRVLAKIAADKQERLAKMKGAEASATTPAPAAQAAAPVVPAAPKPAVTHNEAMLRLRTPQGNIQKTFPAETTLFEVSELLRTEHSVTVRSFSTTFPTKVFEGVDMGKTLREAGCVPNAVLVVKS